MMSRGSGKGGATRGKGNSRRNSLSKSQKENRSNQMNPNNRANQNGTDNRSNQMNPNNSAHDSSRQAAGSPGRWRQRMDSKSASRIQAHADKTDMNQDFKARAQSAAEKNEDENS
tara:strand:- start:188 stop:532 length:345 start_codon:yes stop_codon:yes gene_type:complete